jgi:glycosyltransferase involved in cell wall biosynthesis
LSIPENEIKVSCVIITFNEEDNLPDLLNSVKWCDEIIVVDSGSTDDTINIAEKFGAKVFTKEFAGYGEQKQFAVSLASNDWILSIDADEIVTEKLKENIFKRFSSSENLPKGFLITRRLKFLGKEFKHGRESKKLILRLFNKNSGNFNSAKVHESIELKGKTEELEGLLIHNSYKTLDQYFEKFNHYTSQAAEELFEKGKWRNTVLTYLLFPFYFFKNYFLNGNLLNGKEGLIWAFFSSCYPVIKYSKLLKLYKVRNKKAASKK